LESEDDDEERRHLRNGAPRRRGAEELDRRLLEAIERLRKSNAEKDAAEQ